MATSVVYAYYLINLINQYYVQYWETWMQE
jgi:hypothetical protein